jgi:SAM-dependent methyltransferase
MPIDRYYIEKFIQNYLVRVCGRGLEVGELRYLNMVGTNVSEKSILVPEAGIARRERGAGLTVGDLAAPDSLPLAAFDTFICTQTLQLIYDVRAAIRGSFQLLAPGGTLLGTVPGISQISRYDMDRWGDHWRFTTLSIAKLLAEEFGEHVKVESFGNTVAAQAFLIGAAVEDLPDRAILDYHDDDYQMVIGFCAVKL